MHSPCDIGPSHIGDEESPDHGRAATRGAEPWGHRRLRSYLWTDAYARYKDLWKRRLPCRRGTPPSTDLLCSDVKGEGSVRHVSAQEHQGAAARGFRFFEVSGHKVKTNHESDRVQGMPGLSVQ
ncbi:hypothetical protein NDU88_004506 [Pleurodeles waltl]|uniref:Uncharacterized protein n=1 Tax=Pleurodeles waltl TaxID=8319 RepID=A0AAV7SJ50_PLEWA|nr:hypothetical protein NDU88_004506 [Pleurodeles waltl]